MTSRTLTESKQTKNHAMESHRTNYFMAIHYLYNEDNIIILTKLMGRLSVNNNVSQAITAVPSSD